MPGQNVDPKAAQQTQQNKSRNPGNSQADEAQDQELEAGSANEGEGNRTADRAYRKDLQEFVKEGDVEGQAEAAKKALEGSEKDDLQQAEQKAKRGPFPS